MTTWGHLTSFNGILSPLCYFRSHPCAWKGTLQLKKAVLNKELLELGFLKEKEVK